MQEVEPKGDRRQTPPYLPYKTFRAYIEGSRAGLPSVIDRSVLRHKSGAEQTALLGALRYFSLITALGAPQPPLVALSKTPVDKFSERYAEILRATMSRGYSFLFGESFDLRSATPNQLTTAFEAAGATGDTTRKSIAFFLSAAKDARIEVSPFLKTPRVVKRRTRVTKSAKDTTPRNDPKGAMVNGAQTEGERPMHQRLFELLDPQAMDREEQDAIFTLLRYLKKQGRS
jgi:hypothetical protein